MKCPSCLDTPLLLAERKGIEIDYCPHCRGVWLDRGELDKFILQSEENTRNGAMSQHDSTLQSHPRRQNRDRDDDDDRDDDPRKYSSSKRRKSFWGELFDFD